MKKTFLFSFLLLLSYGVSAQGRQELLPFGDMDSWIVRYIDESAILGGQTKAYYMVGKSDTVISNDSYTEKEYSPWGSSNAYAKVMGIRKVAVSAVPEKRGNGYCCKLQTTLQTVKAAGIDLKALATGSLFTGKLADPITLEGAKNPAKAIDMGMKFTKRPKALMLDYKALILPSEEMKEANASTKVKTVTGHDEGEILLFLQHRWEDADGHIYAYRVGTASEHITSSTDGWQNNHSVEVRYGNITGQGDCKAWEGLTTQRFMARNSKGKMVYVEEVGFNADVEPTHLIIQISSGCQRPYVGCPGNTLWCDNLRLVY